MGSPRIETIGRRTVYRPGEKIAGRIEWDLDRPALALELRLFWYTAGKGDMDVEVTSRLRVDRPGTVGQRDFEFTAPRTPHSFSGKLISIVWALEMVTEPAGEVERLELIISPTGSEVGIP